MKKKFTLILLLVTGAVLFAFSNTTDTLTYGTRINTDTVTLQKKLNENISDEIPTVVFEKNAIGGQSCTMGNGTGMLIHQKVMDKDLEVTMMFFQDAYEKPAKQKMLFQYITSFFKAFCPELSAAQQEEWIARIKSYYDKGYRKENMPLTFVLGSVCCQAQVSKIQGDTVYELIANDMNTYAYPPLTQLQDIEQLSKGDSYQDVVEKLGINHSLICNEVVDAAAFNTCLYQTNDGRYAFIHFKDGKLIETTFQEIYFN